MIVKLSNVASVEHAPGELINLMPLLVAPSVPALPPVATMNTIEVDVGQEIDGKVNVPFESVVRGVTKRAVGVDPFPVVPAA